MKPLPDGGTIGVGAFASSYDMRSEVERGVEWWESRGYRVKLAPGVYARDDYVAGDARSRAADLHALFADPEVDVVQTLQGGFGSSEMIPHLDFDLIAANPKPFVGYSDITSLHVPIRQRAGLPDLLRLRPRWASAPRRRRTSRRSACSRCSAATSRARCRATPTTRTCARSRPAARRRRSSAAASGSSCRRSGRRGSCRPTARSSSSRTRTRRRTTSTAS